MCIRDRFSEYLTFEESAPFSYTYRNFWMSEFVNFEESAPFSYTCRNYDDQLRSVFVIACVYPARCIHYASWIFAESAPFSYTYAKCEVTRRPWDRQIGVKSASSPPRPKSAPRGSKSTTFAGGIFQLFNLQKIGMNPVGDPSVLLTQSPIYLWLQAEVWEAFAIGGWCVVSCTSIQISKFRVQP